MSKPFYSYFSKAAGFEEIPQSENAADIEAFSAGKRTSKRTLASRMWTPLCLLAGLTVGAYLGHCYADRTHDLNNRCIGHISEHSPVTHGVDIKFEEVHFNGSFFQKTVFRQDAGPEVDSAWESLGVDYRPSIVPVEMAEESGLTPNHVQVNPEYGGGFPANVEGLHHLHCLNLLRKSLYYNFDYYHKMGKGPFMNEDHILKDHITHCLDTVRQQLMCTVDVAVLGQVWWDKKDPQAFPDFNTKHMCRNFDAIRQWAEEHQAPEDVAEDYLLPPPSSDAVYEAIP